MTADFSDTRDPFALFAHWLADAVAAEPNDPDAAALATVDAAGMPDVRMVLLRGHGPNGFVFYTNRESAKGSQLALGPAAALCLHWKSLRRQVRIRGPVSEVAAAEADAYFDGRPRGSRIGAWASRQSRPLESRAELEAAVARYGARFGDGPIPRPPYWIGYRITPRTIEFWADRPFRLHDRILFMRTADGGWSTQRLFP